METSEKEWEVTRNAGTVCVDLSGAGRLSRTDTQAIVTAAEHLMDDDVSIVQVQGPQITRPLSGLARTIKAIYRLSETHGAQLVVGPI